MTTDDPFTAPPAAPVPLAPQPPAGTPPQYSAAPLAPFPYASAHPPTAPAKGLGTAALALTGVYTALGVVSALIARSTVESTKEMLENPDPDSPFGNLTNTALGGLSSLVAIAAFVFLALWMMRIRTNLSAVGKPAGGPPNVEWWGWFVPIANFVLPLLGMRAISRRSVGWGILLGWWLPFCAVWLVAPISVSATFRALDPSTGKLLHPEVLDSMVPLAYISAAALVVSWLFLVLIIRRTTARHLNAPAS